LDDDHAPMSSFLSPLRVRLVLVALVAILPTLATILYLESAERAAARERAIAGNLRLTRLAASEQANIFDGARRLLLTLAEFPPLRANDPRACDDLLPKILRDHPGYFNLTVTNADGTLFCAAVPPDRSRLANARQRSWFERATRTRTTAVGDYQLSATTGKPAIAIAHPLLDASGTVTRILTASLGLDRLNAMAAQAELPAGGALTVFDRAGTIVARVPDGDRWVGQQMPNRQPAERLGGGVPEDVRETVGVDGVRRLYVTVPLRASVDTGLYLGMGILPDTAISDSDRIFHRYLGLLGIVSLAALAATMAASQLFVLRPVKALKAVADRLAAGDLSARAQLPRGVAGVRELGDAVDAMAAAVDTRQRERDRAERELRESEDRYRLLFAQNPHPMWVYDRETLEFLEINQAAVQRYGYSREEFLAMRIADIRPADDLPRLSATLAPQHQEPDRTDHWRHRLKSGEIIDVAITSQPLSFSGRPARLITAQDVTDRMRAETALADRIAITSLIADVGVALNRPHELGACLETCAKAAVAHLDAAAVGIWLLNDAGELLELVASAGLYTDIDDAHRRIPLGRFTIGGIAVDRRPDITNQVAEDARLHEHPWVGGEQMVGFAGLPLLVDSRLIGVIALFTTQALSEAMISGVVSVANLMALGITRRRAEVARHFLASIVASSDDAIFGTTLDGTVVSWNDGAERLYGYGAEEIVGRSVSRLCPPDRLGEIEELRRPPLVDQVFRRETVRQCKDGSLVPVSITLSPIRNSEGQTTGRSVIVRDISDRQQTERTLRESEERFRLIAETMTQVFWVADVEIRAMLYVSPAYETIWGRTCESLYRDPRSFLEAIHADDRDRIIIGLRAQQTGEPFDHEYRIIRPGGEVRWVRDRGFPVRIGGERVIRYVGVAEDITDRRLAEGRIRLLARALESTNDMVSVTDIEDRFTFVNGAFLRAYGYSAEEVIGQTPAFLRGEETPDELIAAIARESRRDGWQGELVNRRKDGAEFRISLHTSKIRDEQGDVVGLLGVARDVTEQRSLEDQLRQSQKMEAVGQLAGGVAHDFNNLLTVIQGFAGFLLESLPEPDARRADVEEIRGAAERAAALTRQLLAFSRKQILMVRVLHVGDVVGKLTPMLRRLLGEAVDLRTTIGDRGRVKADPGQLQQVLVNLAVNAHDAMREGGRLTIETSDVVLDQAFARQHPSVRPGPHVMIAVTDTGHGMDPVTLTRIFEPFFTTKPIGRGTGLGLATVYGIVQQSGGSIWVQSEVGRGTTFKVYLPNTEEAEEVDPAAPVEIHGARGEETILLVEDEELVRELAYKVLTRRGYVVHAIADPARAIEFARAHSGTIDLVLTDVIMPEMSGRTMYDRLRPAHPESRVLYMSGYTDDAIVRFGVLEAGTWFLQKPFNRDALAAKVREVLDAGEPAGRASSSRNPTCKE
jgi:PAS domain S-box-containing protein